MTFGGVVNCFSDMFIRDPKKFVAQARISWSGVFNYKFSKVILINYNISKKRKKLIYLLSELIIK